MREQFHWCRGQRIWIVIATSLWMIFPSLTRGQTLVWMDADVNGRRMQTRDVNGGPVQTLIQFQSPPIDDGGPYPEVHFDPITEKLYFLWDTTFERVNIDGSDREPIPTSTVGHFSLNSELARLYWVQHFGDVLHWSPLDGSGEGSHTYPTCCMFATEAVGNDVFFTAGGGTNKGIWRADADGDNEQFLFGTNQPGHLDYDPVEQKLYVVTIFGIVRLNTDGSGFQPIGPDVCDLESAAIVVDHQNRKMYWTDSCFQAGAIRRANLDGTAVETVVTASDVGNPNFVPRGLTIIFEPPPIPSVSQWGFVVLGLCISAAGVCLIRKKLLVG